MLYLYINMVCSTHSVPQMTTRNFLITPHQVVLFPELSNHLVLFVSLSFSELQHTKECLRIIGLPYSQICCFVLHPLEQ